MSTERRRAQGALTAVIAAGLFTSFTTRAHAQACCASGSSLTPIRLDVHERALAGLQSGLNAQHGSYDSSANFRGMPDGASDVELRQTAFATVAPWPRLQLSALVPWVATRRQAAGTPPEWGTGLGDVSFAARYEALQLREYASVPALALVGTLTTPTGTAAEQADHTLGSDATGAGTWRLGGGVALEHDHDAFLFNLTAVISTALPRTAAGVRFTYEPRLDVTMGVGYAVSHFWHGALVLNYEFEGSPSVNGEQGLGRRRLDATLAVTHVLDDDVRLQGALTGAMPVSFLGKNDIARFGGTMALVWSWL